MSQDCHNNTYTVSEVAAALCDLCRLGASVSSISDSSAPNGWMDYHTVNGHTMPCKAGDFRRWHYWYGKGKG